MFKIQEMLHSRETHPGGKVFILYRSGGESGTQEEVIVHSEEEDSVWEGSGKESPRVLRRMRQAYKIYHLPVPEGRRLHCIFQVKGKTSMFKKQPGIIRVIIPGCIKPKGGSRRIHEKVIRQLANAAQNLKSRVNGR